MFFFYLMQTFLLFITEDIFNEYQVPLTTDFTMVTECCLTDSLFNRREHHTIICKIDVEREDCQ